MMLTRPKRCIVFTVLVGLLVGGGSLYYYGYHQWRYQEQQLISMASCLKSLSQQIKQQAQDLLHTQQMNTLQGRQLRKLQQQILKVTGDYNKDWRLIEIDSLFRKADHKLRLEQDLAASRRLLQRAELNLAALNNPALLPIRQALEEDNKRLAAVAQPDDEGVMLQIMMLVNQLDLRSFITMGQPVAGQPQDPKSPATLVNGSVGEQTHWYQSLLRYGARFIGHFITVGRYTGHVEGIAPKGVWPGINGQPLGCISSHCETLRAYLLLASQAAARQQYEHYQQWLGSAVEFIQLHLDPQLPNIAILLEKIGQLRQHARAMKLPQQLQSQELWKGFFQCRMEDEQLPAFSEQLAG